MSGAAAGGGAPSDPGARWRTAIVATAIVLASLVLALTVLRAVTGDGESARRASASASITSDTLPTVPVRLPSRGSFVRAVVQADGTVEVAHWIRASSALDQLILRAYDSPQVVSRPSAVKLEVRTSQGLVSVPDPTIGSEPRVIDLVRPTLLVRLSYTLTGVASQSASPPGRALLGTVALETGYVGSPGSRRVQVGGRQVLNLVCTPQDGGVLDQRPCGEPREGGWSVNLPPRSSGDHVTAQVDLDSGPSENPDATSASS